MPYRNQPTNFFPWIMWTLETEVQATTAPCVPADWLSELNQNQTIDIITTNLAPCSCATNKSRISSTSSTNKSGVCWEEGENMSREDLDMRKGLLLHRFAVNKRRFCHALTTRNHIQNFVILFRSLSFK